MKSKDNIIAATKYAKVLYGIDVNTKEGSINNLAGHSVVKGTGGIDGPSK